MRYVANYAKAALLIPAVLLAGCVSQSKYDALQMQNQKLEQQVAAEQAHVSRLQGAIKYTVNSDLLFASARWDLSADGKDIIGKLAKTLAAGQQDKLVVNGFTDDAPIGPGLKRQGVNSNQELSQKRAESVMAYMISQGVNPALVAAKGFGDAQPVATNDTAQGRAQNRRVELTLAGA
jgi:chemotaxis protein MotB